MVSILNLITVPKISYGIARHPAASAHATIQCAIELRDRDLRGDLATIQIPALILHGADDKICLFDLARVMHDGIKDSACFI
jgi:pimeloyl-ACP methyl ester carboxylesterase